MRKLIERITIFVIGIPVFFALIFLLDEPKHLAYNIVVILFSAIGTAELSSLLKRKNINISKIEAAILGSLAPLSGILTNSFDNPLLAVEIFVTAGAVWAVLSVSITKKENIETAASRIAGRLTLIMYPGFFMYWIVKMSVWNSSALIFLFLITVFFNDSAAWLFGSLFGKNNKGLIPASPNKSIAGFIGGLAGTALIAVLAVLLFPEIFGSSSENLMTKAVLLCLFTGIFATLGDLAESAIKRSCDFKDSGNVILGRGGILDCIDSISIAAPVFFFFMEFFFIK